MIKLNNELLPHQKAAAEKLIKLKVGALFMEQGTGKTITTLEIARIRLKREKIEHIIWLCPCSVKNNLRREIVKQCPEEMLDKVTICGIETLSTSIRAISYLMKMTANKKCFLVVSKFKEITLVIVLHGSYLHQQGILSGTVLLVPDKVYS